MQSFLTALIECSISMSVLILLLIAITPLLEKRYAAKWRYYTWLVIVIGLIIPFRPHIDTTFIQVDTPASLLMITQYLPINGTNLNTAENYSSVPWYILVFYLWLAGAITFIAYHIIRHYHFIKIVKRWVKDISNQQVLDTLQKLKDDMGMSKQVKIQLCSCIESPMMIGFANASILLPTDDYSKDELSFILRHEMVHIQRKDLLYKSLALIATAIHWFNPLVYLMSKVIAVQCEISCDVKVVQNTNMDGRQQYSETIIGVIKNQSRMQTAFSTNFYGGKKGMKHRIFTIMDTTKKRAGIFILCLVLIGTMTSGVAFAASSANADFTSSDEYTFSQTYSQNGEFTNLTAKDKHFVELKGEKVVNIQNGEGVAHDIENGYTAIYKKGDKDWTLEKGETVNLSFHIKKQLEDGQTAVIGYIKNNIYTDFFVNKIRDEISIKFVAPDDGEYSFYLVGASSDKIEVTSCSIN